MVLLETETYRKGEFHLYGITVGLTGRPFGHLPYYAYGFLTAAAAGIFQYSDAGDGTVFIDYEAQRYRTLNVIFAGDGRIADVVAEELLQFGFTTWERRQLLDVKSFIYFLWFGAYRFDDV